MTSYQRIAEHKIKVTLKYKHSDGRFHNKTGQSYCLEGVRTLRAAGFDVTLDYGRA